MLQHCLLRRNPVNLSSNARMEEVEFVSEIKEHQRTLTENTVINNFQIKEDI
jgi:hypothetical protein